MTEQSVEQRLVFLRRLYETSDSIKPGSDLEIFFTKLAEAQERERVLVAVLWQFVDGSPPPLGVIWALTDVRYLARAALRKVGALEEP